MYILLINLKGQLTGRTKSSISCKMKYDKEKDPL